jgi:hypothetical protein
MNVEKLSDRKVAKFKVHDREEIASTNNLLQIKPVITY